jgi:hypothetical protein
VFVTVTFGVVLLLLFAGLAVDTARFWVAKSRLQRSADAAGISGLGLRAVKGWRWIHNGDDPGSVQLGVPGANDGEVARHAEQVAVDNMRAKGLVPEASTVVSASFTSQTDTIIVRISHTVPSMLLARLGVLGRCTFAGCEIDVSSTAQLAPANVALVLDSSGSMQCPEAPGQSCDCRMMNPPNDCASRFAGAQIQDGLKRAVLLDFLKYFNPNRDRISIVPFNIIADPDYFSIRGSAGAVPAVPFGADRTRYDRFLAKLASLQPLSNTNPCDGLAVAYQDFSAASPGVFDSEATFFVLFTDGAPNAGRFAVTDTRLDMDDLLAAGNPNDWVHYAIEWNDDGTRYHGPSPLVRRQDVCYGYTPGNFCPPRRLAPGEAPGPAVPAGAVSCGTVEQDPSAYVGHLDRCVGSFSFSVPGVGTAPTGWDVGMNEYLHQYYHCALEVGDAIRARGGRLYSIGLGQAPTPGSYVGDPYEDPANEFMYKSDFLARLALDLWALPGKPEFGPRRQEGTVTNPSNPPVGRPRFVGYNGARSVAAATAAYPDRDGFSLNAGNTEELRFAFTRIAKQILLDLVE